MKATAAPGSTGIWLSTGGMAILAVILLLIAYTRGQHLQGVKNGMRTFTQVLPMLFFAFVVIGTLPLILPKEIFVRWLSAESAWRGILVGTLAGGIAPGGPVIQSIIAAGLFKAGAGVGTIVSFLSAGVLWNLSLIPIEAGILGWRLVFARIASSFFFPPIAGFIAHVLFERFVR